MSHLMTKPTKYCCCCVEVLHPCQHYLSHFGEVASDFVGFLPDIELNWPKPHHNKIACVPSEGSDQPGHLPGLIRVFAVCMKKVWVMSYPISAQQRLWSDWVIAGRTGHFVGFVMSWLKYPNNLDTWKVARVVLIFEQSGFQIDIRTFKKLPSLIKMRDGAMRDVCFLWEHHSSLFF